MSKDVGMWAFLEQYVSQLAEREGFLAICVRKIELNHSEYPAQV